MFKCSIKINHYNIISNCIILIINIIMIIIKLKYKLNYDDLKKTINTLIIYDFKLVTLFIKLNIN